ncbi:L-seryl-tRNA(Sec) selenium transferase [Actinokineospora sp. NBRC 105648]|uniref:L-seryl-tRNA(Sec) selenium transferase n=1 Tax=Actinokineospora sp. NBRC 105648 TaxID=3032206 RepID=UPI0024A00CEE|nr:L-seryl-tRNA(Sec) selenium transferase [Actinokineospora sp. NBRC 105648]GLZ42856.1 L-seryl-tRNA(Sec) selenium transferase [Actinokineospora sp. NBRC 105648]
MTDPRRVVPRTDAVLAELADEVQQYGRSAVKAEVVVALQRVRDGKIAAERVVDEVRAALDTGPRAVLNATGVVVHTNLGRAPLSDAAKDAVLAAAGTTDVEFDLATGARRRRGENALAALRSAVPDAGDVHVVNNNAAALLLCALAMAADREIVISRGELVEIGDGFRIPDLLCASGARLREVGTTNRTSVRDYADAVGPDTGFILRVHPSNYRVTGFGGTPRVDELIGLGVPVVVDIGSGLLTPHPLLPDEPDATTVLRAGATLVTASADKLLGGPQAGLLFGEAALVERLRRHPAARALRVDKLTLAALAATVRGPRPPVRTALEAGQHELLERAQIMAKTLAAQGVDAQAVSSTAVVGGGGAPGVELPSAAVSLPERYAVALRTGRVPVVGRVERGRCLLDLRTVAAADDAVLLEAVLRCT